MSRPCWAKAMSKCSDKMSGEHLLSKSLFPRGFTIRGFPWCKDEFKTVGVNALRANVLCSRHNSMLSPLDAAAKDVWCVLRYVSDLNADRQREVTAGIWHRRSKTTFPLDGLRFERWAFKTAINMVASGNCRGFPKEWAPPPELAKFVFGQGVLPDGCGLGIAVVLGERVADQDHISFGLLQRTDRPGAQPEVEGFLMEFRGLRLAGSSAHPLASLHAPKNPINPEAVLLRPRRLEFLPSAAVTFDWTQVGSSDSPSVRRARRRFDCEG